MALGLATTWEVVVQQSLAGSALARRRRAQAEDPPHSVARFRTLCSMCRPLGESQLGMEARLSSRQCNRSCYPRTVTDEEALSDCLGRLQGEGAGAS